jgi:hypothetical protein
MPTALKQITTRAKAIRSKHPRMDWKTAVQQASKEYKRGKLSGPKRKAAKRVVRKVARKAAPRVHRAASKKAAGVFAGVFAGTGNTLGSCISGAQRVVENQIGKLVVQQVKAKGVRDKRKIGKTIAAKKVTLRKLCGIK